MRTTTEATGLVLQALRALPSMGGLALVTGPDGIGKSTAVELAAESLPHLRRIVPTPAPNGASPRAFFREVALRLGITVSQCHGATDLSMMIEQHVKQRSLLLVIDECEDLPKSWLPCYRFLADMLGCLALVGGDEFRARIENHGALVTRTRVPLEPPAPTIMEAARHYGEEFANDWIAAAHADASGLWGPMETIACAERMRSQDLGRDTRVCTAEDARHLAKHFLLRRAA